MKRLLFVDDDPQVLDGLRNMLRPQRKRWEMVFANGGEAALAQMEAAPFDVVVSDMRMPKIDGAALLRRVGVLYPRTVRIVLSGQTEMETALRSVSFAHQFLSKPCDPELLRNVLDRACELNALLGSETLRQAAASIKRLPATPQVFLQVREAVSDPNLSLKRLAELLAQDVAICARVLQLVNSPFFGLSRRISSVLEAVTYLGVTTIKSLVLSVESFTAFSGAKCRGFSLPALQRHSLFTGNLAKHVIGDARRGEHAFMAGLLHDIGMLVLATHFPEQLQALTAKPGWAAADEDTEGLSHAHLGAYLLGLWGLPYPVIEAVAHHHEPSRVDHTAFDLPDAVYVADHLALECLPGGDHGAEPRLALDVDHLARLGVGEARVAEWRAHARALAESGDGG